MKDVKCLECGKMHHNVADSIEYGVIKCFCGHEILVAKDTFIHDSKKADVWDEKDRMCNFCGSLHPAVLMYMRHFMNAS